MTFALESLQVRPAAPKVGFGNEAPNAGESDEWFTPPWLFEAMGLTFDLDPCQPMYRSLPWVPAKKRYTPVDDGLKQPWHGCVWLNPPYGRATATWLARLAKHGEGMALVFARTDTAWFQDVAQSAQALLFLRGRVSFVSGAGKPAGRPAAPSVLLGWGSACAAALEGMAPKHGVLAVPA